LVAILCLQRLFWDARQPYTLDCVGRITLSSALFCKNRRYLMTPSQTLPWSSSW